MTDNIVKKAKREKPVGVNFWEPEEEQYLWKNCKGYSTIPEIAKVLKRSQVSVARRIALAMSKRETSINLEDRLACIMHSLDLLASGGSFRDARRVK